VGAQGRQVLGTTAEVDVVTQPVGQTSEDEAANEVHLRGRWVGTRERELPSGDVVVVARVVVPRPGGGVDTLACAVWTPALRRRVMRLADGCLVDVTGSLRRRFWRTPVGASSRYEVEVSRLRRLGSTGSRQR
jgi:single-strand DNA-binding protein